MKRSAILAFACALLTACGQSGPVADGAENTASLPPPDQAAPDPTAAAPANATASPSGANVAQPVNATKIPPALHGRWGMSPGDCTSTRGDAKGLLTITANDLRFYESVAVPQAELDVGPDSIRGNFNFTGEGQSWTKFQDLRLKGGELVRTESNPTASYSYAKCN